MVLLSAFCLFQTKIRRSRVERASCLSIIYFLSFGLSRYIITINFKVSLLATLKCSAIKQLIVFGKVHHSLWTNTSRRRIHRPANLPKQDIKPSSNHRIILFNTFYITKPIQYYQVELVFCCLVYFVCLHFFCYSLRPPSQSRRLYPSVAP